MSPATPPLLLYDGACGLCASSVQFILRHERRHELRFAPLQGTLAADIRARHARLQGVDSMVWVEQGQAGERVFVRSAAALRAAVYMGGAWRLLGRAAMLVPRALRDAVYDFIARHRHRMFGEDVCFLPPPDVRQRFVE
ncbi:MAG: thiol-disulfide oxidoreductase DCC family protein [Vicinamibacterales bacterium]